MKLNSPKIKKIITSAVLALSAVSLLAAWYKLTTLQWLGFCSGMIWMLYNLYGYLFNQSMSMRGGIVAEDGNAETQAKRLLVFLGSLAIYIVLIVESFR